MTLRRVVVTGMGAVSPNGIGRETYWKNTSGGVSGTAPITLFDASRHSTTFGCEVKGFDPLKWVEKKEVKKMDRFIQFAVAAADFAMADAGLAVTPENAEMVGVYVGSGIGGFRTIEDAHSDLVELDIGGPRIVARVTRSATRSLGLRPALPLHVLVKSVSVRPMGPGNMAGAGRSRGVDT